MASNEHFEYTSCGRLFTVMLLPVMTPKLKVCVSVSNGS